MCREIKVYQSENGKSPFNDWLFSLKDVTGRFEVLERIRRLRTGYLGVWKRIGKIYELKISKGPGYRVYFGKDGESIVILLIGGSKKTQKKDIEKASNFWIDYKRRFK